MPPELNLVSLYEATTCKRIATTHGRDASISQGYPQQYVAGTHLKHLSEEKQCGEVSKLRKQHSNAENKLPSNRRPSGQSLTI